MMVTRFRLYPDSRRRTGLFVRVLVFDRRGELVAFWRALGNRGPVRAWCAEVTRYSANGRRDPLVATVCFWRREMGVGYVAHEFFHATMAWARRTRASGAELTAAGEGTLDLDSLEERLARVHGDLVRQFVAGADRAGLYDREQGG
jgi:hypothetical protein